MPKKKRGRPVHYTTFTYVDGAAWTCTPTRKPKQAVATDADFVINELLCSAKEFHDESDAIRARISDILATRINARRAIREIAMPSLARIEVSLLALHERLERIEQALGLKQQPPTEPS